jgi:hypothetical protein
MSIWITKLDHWLYVGFVYFFKALGIVWLLSFVAIVLVYWCIRPKQGE